LFFQWVPYTGDIFIVKKRAKRSAVEKIDLLYFPVFAVFFTRTDQSGLPTYQKPMNSLITPGHVSVTPTFLVPLDLHVAEYEDDKIVAVEEDAKLGRRRKRARPSEEVLRIIADTTNLLISWGMPSMTDYDGPEPIEMLMSINSDVEKTFKVSKTGRNIFPKNFAPTPIKAPKTMSVSAPVLTGTALKLSALLSEYDRQVVKDVAQLRTYITNRLVEISSCGDTKSELRALELLGKISDVGLFVEKSEITITATTPAQLEHAIKEKINRILGRENIEIEEAEYAEDYEEELEEEEYEENEEEIEGEDEDVEDEE
jgi:hypothetical protein